MGCRALRGLLQRVSRARHYRSSVDVMERSRRAAASLQRYLAPLEFTDWSAARVTAELTQVVHWGVEHGMAGAPRGAQHR